MGGFYRITNNITGKIYFGITSKDPNSRLRQHTERAEKGYEKYKLHNAIVKYGIKNFTFKIICNSNNWNSLCKLEIFFIAKYKTQSDKYGYNMTPGGDGTGKGKLNQNYGTKRPENAKYVNYINEILGNPMKDERILKEYFLGEKHPIHRNISVREALINNGNEWRNKQSQKVIKIDPLDGKELEIFDSLKEASNSVGLKQSVCIVDCIKGIQKLAGGFKWKYFEERAYTVYDRIDPINGDVLETFYTLREVEIFTGVKYSSRIKKSIEQNSVVYDFKWNKRQVGYSEYKRKYNGTCKSIPLLQINSETNEIINSFNSKSHAVMETGFSLSIIEESISKNLIVKGIKWKLA